MDKTNKKAKPAKLDDGSWGVRVEGRVTRGDVVTVTTRSGKTWDAVIEREICATRLVSLCSTQKPATKKVRATSRFGAGHGQTASMPGYSSYCTDNASCNCYDCAS